MSRIIKCLPVILIAFFLTSCLKSDLKELPAFSNAEITNFRFEYRWFDDAIQQLRVIQITTKTTIDKAGNKVSCDLTVPVVSASFPQSVRDGVLLSKLVGYADISNAATLQPVADSPKLGLLADFSKSNLTYEVTAADGATKKNWALVITSFTK